MNGHAWIERILHLSLAAALNACAAAPSASARDVADANDTGRTLAADTANEREVLRRLSSLPNGKAQRVGDANVIAQAPYDAASGHICRELQLTPDKARTASRRLACSDGRIWFFVPDVFRSAIP